jgi:DNA-binding NarL/FixJ family response regulator
MILRPYQTDLLADMMAEGKGYGEIADELGRTKWSVRSRWNKIIRAMGWQAA